MTTHTEKFNTTSVSEQTLEGLKQQVRAWAARQALKYRLAQERRHLADLSDAQLRDIGISRADAELEAASDAIPAARLNMQD